MNDAQNALLARLRELIVETPKSGALNAAKRPLHVTRFAQAVERRAEDGPKLVAYVRAKVTETPTESYTSLVAAGRPDLTIEALVADADAPWASEFSDDERDLARDRLGNMVAETKARKEATEATAVEHDRKIVGLANKRRVAEGKPGLTAKQESEMLARLAAERARRAS